MTTALSPLMSLSGLLSQRQIHTQAQKVTFQVSEDWQQGRTIFGGALSALAVQAMRDVCGADWPLRALQTSFVGPVTPGHFEVEVTLLRQGKNIRQVQARICQDNGQGEHTTAGVLLAVFGVARASAIPVLSPARPPVARPPETSDTMPHIPGITPNFLQHIDFRLSEGAFPFTGSNSWSSRIHVRMKDAQDLDTELLSVVFADAGPTPALAQVSGLAMASSVSWSLELRPVPQADGHGMWRMDKDALAVADGYVNERTSLWTPEGQLAALGYQVVAIYA